MFADYLPVLIAFLFAVGMSLGMIIFARFVGWRKPNEVKSTPFECGNIPLTDARMQFDVKFYLVALLFLLFDVETIFILLWAVSFNYFKEQGVAVFMLLDMFLFMALLIVGYVFAWMRGGLTWK